MFGMQFLRSELSIRNCLHTLVLAVQYDCHQLFEDAVCHPPDAVLRLAI